MDEMGSRYQVHRHRYGWLVFGAVPVGDLATLCRLVPGEQLHDQRVADYYHAAMALCSEADSVLWRKLIGVDDVPQR